MSAADILAYVSLVIAIIAFFLSVAQGLQQYISTAEGYRKCAESVVGPWVKHRRRYFVLGELRFAVAFKTPVFFVATPTNDRGPVEGTLIRNVEGTEQSKGLTLSWNPVHAPKEKDGSGDLDPRAGPWYHWLLALSLHELINAIRIIGIEVLLFMDI